MLTVTKYLSTISCNYMPQLNVQQEIIFLSLLHDKEPKVCLTRDRAQIEVVIQLEDLKIYWVRNFSLSFCV